MFGMFYRWGVVVVLEQLQSPLQEFKKRTTNNRSF